MSDALLERFTGVFLRELGESAKQEAVTRIHSRTLQRAVVVSTEQSSAAGTGRKLKIRLHLPHYWAIYEHEGRDAITFPPGKYMVFFPDIKDDPRVDGGNNYPVTKADRRKLTREQFRYFSKVNRANKAAGLPPIMVVTQSVGPADFSHFDGPNPYFRDGVRDVFDSGLAASLASAMITHYLESTLPRLGRDRAVMSI